jgi:hypothetical protein
MHTTREIELDEIVKPLCNNNLSGLSGNVVHARYRAAQISTMLMAFARFITMQPDGPRKLTTQTTVAPFKDASTATALKVYAFFIIKPGHNSRRLLLRKQVANEA